MVERDGPLSLSRQCELLAAGPAARRCARSAGVNNRPERGVVQSSRAGSRIHATT